MRQVTERVGWLVTVALAVSACQAQPGQVARQPDVVATAIDERVELARSARPDDLEAVSLALLPENDVQMWERLGAADRKVVADFYENFGTSVMAFDNKEELLWLIRQGYPMPEDVLDAATQSEQELEARFMEGDVKAGYFLLDRQAAAIGQDPPDLESYLKSKELADELLVIGGPFAGYSYYRFNREIDNSESRALAGLLWADWQGDYRAGQQLIELTGMSARDRSDTVPDPASLAFAYQALLGSIRARNPAVLARRIEPLIIHKRPPENR